MEVKYYLDGVDFHQYGVFVSASDGLLSKPKMKAPMSLNWDNYHGEMVDLRKKYYEARTIKLECFVMASCPGDFVAKVNAFQELFAKPWTRRLSVAVDASEPLLYEVYCEDGIEIKSKWSKETMVGTFTLNLKEPEPIKRVYKWTRGREEEAYPILWITSNKMLNVYWGDGEHTFDVSGNNIELSHYYENNGTYYIVITGDIDATDVLIETDAILVWNKL